MCKSFCILGIAQGRELADALRVLGLGVTQLSGCGRDGPIE